MEGIIFDLKTFRSKQLNGMSQEEFAKQVGISQDRVSRMEADPSQVSLEILIKIATHFGMTLDELIVLPKPDPQGLSVDDAWGYAEYYRYNFIDYVKRSDIGNVYEKEISELSALVKKIIQKPKVAFIGRSDVGKSTMINTLLGGEKRMPAHWTPATSIAVYIKHVKDRPSYMNEDVWVFRSDEITDELWDDTRLEDREYCESLKLSSGNYDLLNTYGTRQGEHFAESKATAAVVFIDSSLLLNCDIVDLPGYGTGDRGQDDKLSLRGKSKADVLVYLSIANGFMRGEDISYLKEAIPMLPDIWSGDDVKIKPLANLFIVASQAYVIDGGNQAELNNILVSGCERFKKSLTDGFWNEGQTPEALSDRFYYYASNPSILRERFDKDFRMLIETLPQIIVQRARKIVRKWVNSKDVWLCHKIEEYQQLLDERKECEEILRKCEKNKHNQYAFFKRERRRIIEKIEKYGRESKDEIAKYYRDTITVENLVFLMEQKGIKKKKDDLQIFSAYVSGLLQDKTNEVLKKKSEQLEGDINQFLNEFEHSTVESIDSIMFKNIPFNKEQAFAAGLTGIATYGALAIWAASFGNLGGYILIAKGVSILSALGISVGGTAAAISAVAAIGGPVVLGIALSLIAAATVFAAFSGNWRKQIAKKILEVYGKERVLDKIESNINDYWKDTKIAFNASADSLEAEWEKYVATFRKQLQNYDADAIRKAQKDLEMKKSFLRDILKFFDIEK